MKFNKKLGIKVLTGVLSLNLLLINPVMAEEIDEKKAGEDVKQVEEKKAENKKVENKQAEEKKAVDKKDEDKKIEEPSIFGEYAATIELDTGELLYGKNENVKAYPASITKIMTALLLVENTKKGDKIEIANACYNITRSGSQAYHEEGETMDRDTALYAMLVTSANDLACSIGVHIAGDEESFGKMMTERAKEIGAVNTTFVTASGLDAVGHQTTAYDMALITREAVKHDVILDAMHTKVFEEKTSRQTVSVTNSNKINKDKDSLGGKTGFTNQARNTLVKIDKVDGKTVINVVMKSNLDNLYTDNKAISNYGIAQLETYKFDFEQKEEIFGKEVLVGIKDKIELNLTDKKDKEKVELSFELDKKLKEDEISKDGIVLGDKLGKVLVKYNGETIKTVDAVAKEDAQFKSGFLSKSNKESGDGMSRSLKALLAILVPVFGYLILMTYYNRKVIESRKKRKK